MEAAGAREAQYHFRQLHTWYHQVVTAVGADDGVTMSDIDEVRNRIVVGVADASGIGSVRAAVSGLNVPTDVIVVEQVDPVEIEPSLRDRTRPVIAGVEINGAEGTCTLGYNVAHWFVFEFQEEHFLTNAHCTTSFGQVTGMSMGQKVSSDIIGTESVDPPLFTNSSDPRCPVGRQCRYSDAALFLYNGTSFNHGIVPWPDVGSINYSSTNSITDIGDPIVGMTVHKVGRTTGHTTGVVSQTCADFGQSLGGFDTGRTMLCQARGNYSSGPGDSGSPVVSVLSDGTLSGRGIHWGSGGVFSTASEWALEMSGASGFGLGHGFCVTISCAPPPPPPPPSLNVAIFGPTMVPPNESCFYSSTVSGGTGIYSYQWLRNGVPIGTGSSVNVWTGDLSRYTLRLNVSDTGGANGFDQLSATVSSQAPPCFN